MLKISEHFYGISFYGGKILGCNNLYSQHLYIEKIDIKNIEICVEKCDKSPAFQEKNLGDNHSIRQVFSTEKQALAFFQAKANQLKLMLL